MLGHRHRDQELQSSLKAVLHQLVGQAVGRHQRNAEDYRAGHEPAHGLGVIRGESARPEEHPHREDKRAHYVPLPSRLARNSFIWKMVKVSERNLAAPAVSGPWLPLSSATGHHSLFDTARASALSYESIAKVLAGVYPPRNAHGGHHGHRTPHSSLAPFLRRTREPRALEAASNHCPGAGSAIPDHSPLLRGQDQYRRGRGDRSGQTNGGEVAGPVHRTPPRRPA